MGQMTQYPLSVNFSFAVKDQNKHILFVYKFGVRSFIHLKAIVRRRGLGVIGGIAVLRTGMKRSGH